MEVESVAADAILLRLFGVVSILEFVCKRIVNVRRDEKTDRCDYSRFTASWQRGLIGIFGIVFMSLRSCPLPDAS